MSCAALDQLQLAFTPVVSPGVLVLSANGTVLILAVIRANFESFAPILVDDLPVCIERIRFGK